MSPFSSTRDGGAAQIQNLNRVQTIKQSVSITNLSKKNDKSKKMVVKKIKRRMSQHPHEGLAAAIQNDKART
jgi:hypothetical protein